MSEKEDQELEGGEEGEDGDKHAAGILMLCLIDCSWMLGKATEGF